MKRHIKRFLALAVSACLVCGLFPALSLKVAAASVIEYLNTRTNGSPDVFTIRANTDNFSAFHIDSSSGNQRMIFLTYDLADYINSDTQINEIKFQFYFNQLRVSGSATGTGTSGLPNGTSQQEDAPIGFYILNEGHDVQALPLGTATTWSALTNLGNLTQPIRLIDKGINDDPGAVLAYWRPWNNTTTPPAGLKDSQGNLVKASSTTVMQETGDLWPAIKERLGGDNYISKEKGTSFTLRISCPKDYVVGSTHVLENTTAGSKAPKLSVSFNNSNIDRVSAAVSAVTPSVIAPNEDLNNITKNLNLPEIAGDNVSVTWKSTDPRYVTNSGIVTRPAYGDTNKSAVLNATFSYGGYTLRGSYPVTVLSNKEKPEHANQPGEATARTLYATDGGFVRSGASAGVSMANLGNNKLIGGNINAENNIAFVKFNLASKKSLLFDKTDSIMLRLVPFNYLPLQTGQTNLNASSVDIKVSLVDNDTWDNTLTYNSAASMLTGGVGLYTSKGTLDLNGYYTGNLLGALQTYFATNPSKDSVTLRVEATSGTFAFHGAPAGIAADLSPSLISISSEIATGIADEYLTFDKISSEVPTRVRENLDYSNLAANLSALGLHSTSITWSLADGPSPVLDPITGVVTRQQKDTSVNLMAAITSGTVIRTKKFPITIMGYDSSATYFQNLLGGITFDTMIITGQFPIPAKLEGMTVSWETNDPDRIFPNGTIAKVTRPQSMDMNIKLTATISETVPGTENITTVSKDFNFLVLREKSLLAGKAVKDRSGSKERAVDDDTFSLWVVDPTDRRLTIDTGGSKDFFEFLLVYEGSAVSGVVVSTSQDYWSWEPVYTANVQPGIANYMTLALPKFAQYVRLELPKTGITAVREFCGYAFATKQNQKENPLQNLDIPKSVSSDFQLSKSVEGHNITWTSNNSSVIAVDGYTAKVTRYSSDRNATLTPSITVDETVFTWNYVVVVNKTNGGNTGGGSNGGGSRTTPFSIYKEQNTLTPPPTPTTEVFTDLGVVPWATEYINALCDKGIINGFGDGTFAPNGLLKREEMTKLLVVGFDLKGGQNNVQFADVSPDEWYYNYVNNMCSSGLATGIGENLFGAGLKITRQDAAVLLSRILTMRGITASSEESTFSDYTEIAEYARESVSMLQALKIIGGDENGNFNPEANITRAEAAKIIFLALQLLK